MTAGVILDADASRAGTLTACRHRRLDIIRALASLSMRRGAGFSARMMMLRRRLHRLPRHKMPTPGPAAEAAASAIDAGRAYQASEADARALSRLFEAIPRADDGRRRSLVTISMTAFITHYHAPSPRYGY